MFNESDTFALEWSSREVSAPLGEYLTIIPRVRVGYEMVDSQLVAMRPGVGITSRISGWGCAAGTLEPLTYTRASSAKFCYPILE